MNKLIIIVFLAISFNVSASLEDELLAIHKSEKADIQKIQNAKEATRIAALKAEKIKYEAKEHQRRIVQKNKAKQAELASKKEAEYNSERLGDKYRDQSFEDKVRQLNLEEMRMKLVERKAMSQARIGKAEAFAENEVQKDTVKVEIQRARTDVARKNAESDATLKSKLGDALVEKAKNPDTYNVNIKKKEEW